MYIMLISKKRNYLTAFNCLSKLFEVDFLKKIRYEHPVCSPNEHPKPLGSVHLYIVNVSKPNQIVYM